MRVAIEEARIQSDKTHQFLDHFRLLGGRPELVDYEWLADDIENGHARV